MNDDESRNTGSAAREPAPERGSARAMVPGSAAVRELFEIPQDVTYLNCASLAPQLRATTAAGCDAVRAKATPWRLEGDEWFAPSETLRALAAEVAGADADAIAIVPAASYGIAVAAKNAVVRPGQSIIVLDREFPSNVLAWSPVARRSGGRIVTVTREPGEPWTEAILDAIDESTAVVCVPHCGWTDGSLVDLERIGARARAVRAMLVVDASQSLGAFPLDLARIQPDFLVAVGYKWLLGPYGLGYLYASPRWCAQGEPLEESWLTRTGSEDFASLVEGRDKYRPGARRFDMGEFPQFVLTPMAASALRQVLAWGVETIQQSLAALTKRASQQAAELGFSVPPPDDRVGHMIGIGRPGGIPRALPRALARERIYVAVRGGSIRISPHLYNSESDIDRLFETIARTLGE